MRNLSRRSVLKFGAAGAGTLMLPMAPPAAAESTQDPHFFLLIVLDGGADSSYMFDARPLSMTRAGRIQNYLGQEPMPWIGYNGVAARATSLARPLFRYRNDFSVLNGVCMTPSFDGHLQNMNFLLTGNPFGGSSFVPQLNAAETGRQPGLLDAVLPGSPLFANLDNHSRVVPLQAMAVAGLSTRLKQMAPLQPGNELADFIDGRLAANTAEPGRFASAAGAMREAMRGTREMHRRLAQLVPPRLDLPPEEQAVALISQCFRLSIARSAIYVASELFDVHAPEQAITQPKLFAGAIDKILTLLDGLCETQFDSKKSMFEVTTVMIASEMGRTFRASGLPVHFTGTNHNQFANSFLLGGKGIRGGLVIGASDAADERELVSKAHLSVDPFREKAVGRPFDFATLKPRPDLPDTFDIQDYLTVGSVVNTLYALFGVPSAHYRSLRRDLPVAPVLNGLLV